MSRALVKSIHLALAKVGSAAGEDALSRWLTKDDRLSVKRADSLLCRALLRGVLAGATQSAPERWRITKTRAGKPMVVNADGSKAPSVSISHSGEWSACALSFAGDVGIDIERMRCDRNLSGIARRAFGPLECAEVEAEGCVRFYAIWTLREAIAKALGTGLAMAADRKDRVAGGTHSGFRQVTLEDDAWQIMQETLGSGLSLAVALRGSAEPALQWWPAEP